MCGAGCAAVLCALLAMQAQVRDADAQPARGTLEVAATLQDVVQAATNTRTQFGAFANRVGADAERLQQEFQKQQTEIADLQLEKQQLEAGRQQDRQKLQQELEDFKHRALTKMSELQNTDRRLEEANEKLTASNQQLSNNLQAETSKKDSLMKQLQKMAQLYQHQSNAVQQAVEQQQRRIADEISSNMRDALEAAGESSLEAAPLPVAQPFPAAQEALDTLSALPPLSSAQPMSVAAPALRGAPAVREPVEVVAAQPTNVAPGFVPNLAVTSALPVQPTYFAAALPAQPVFPAAAPPAQPMYMAAQPLPTAVHRHEDAPPRAAAQAVPPPVPARRAARVPAARPVPAAQPVANAARDDEELKSLRAQVDNLEKGAQPVANAVQPVANEARDDEELKGLRAQVQQLEAGPAPRPARADAKAAAQAAPARAAPVQAAPAARPTAARQPTPKAAPPPQRIASPQDDEQLKSLRSEVEQLEATVKTEDSDDAPVSMPDASALVDEGSQ